MITVKELEDLGFTQTDDEKEEFKGEPLNFHKKIDNGHIIPDHDTTTIIIKRHYGWISIYLFNESSWVLAKDHAFSGKCPDVKTFNLLLKLIL